MRLGFLQRARAVVFGVGSWGTVWVLAVLPAWGQELQVPQPRVRDINERSGLLQRFELPERFLPPDHNRLQYDNTRWGRFLLFNPLFVNKITRGGLYGRPWKQTCTASYYPFFQGSPGENTLRPDCLPRHRALRVVENTVHPFHPVGMYYHLGSYVPIYDLDPWVPGPGPYPWPWYYKGYLFGG